MNHNFKILQVDTDGLILYKEDGSIFSEDEQSILLNEINSILPPLIQLDIGGLFSKVLVMKSKNYIMQTSEGKIKYKGSSLKDSKKEINIRKFMNEIIGSILENDINHNLINIIYEKYIIKVNNIKDIKEWAVKRTYTKSVMTSERTNESKVRDALKDENMSEGDKVYLYTTKNDELKLTKHWIKGDENPNQLIKRIWNTLNIFKEILDMSKFTKYHLKTKKKELLELLKNKYDS